jgi:hypothetical protein
MAVRGVLVSLVAAILAAMALAQGPAATRTTSNAANASSAQIAASGIVVAELAKALDSKKARAGDKIDARVTMDVLAHGEIVIPRGTRIIGRVTNANARTKEVSESLVEIAFDRIVLKNGRELPLKATIQAVGAPTQTLVPGDQTVSDVDSTESRPGPGKNEMRRIISSAYPGSVHPASAGASGGPTDGNSPQTSLGPSLGPGSQGVVGIKGIVLSNSAQGSAICSTSRNFHLSQGTQLVLRILEPQVLLDSLRRTRN